MRLWISPELELHELEPGGSHSMAVVADPERFMIGRRAMLDYMDRCNADDADEPFDFEAVIVLAEMSGWVRTSHDAPDGRLAVSASSAAQARCVIRRLEADGHHLGGIDLSIERIVGDAIRSEFRILDIDALARFIRHGRLPAATHGDIPFDACDLVRTVLEERAAGGTLCGHRP